MVNVVVVYARACLALFAMHIRLCCSCCYHAWRREREERREVGPLSWRGASCRSRRGNKLCAYPLQRSDGRLHSQMWTTHGLCSSAGFLGPMQTTLLLFFALNPSFFSLQELKQWSWAVTGHSGPSSYSKESWSPHGKILGSETRTEDKHIKASFGLS